MKTYVIMLSKRFPKGHRRAGEPTRFRCAFLQGRGFCRDCFGGCDFDGNAKSSPGRTCSRNLWDFKKIHTIRANYPLWAKRIAEVERGGACLSIRQWTDKPYRSKQVEIARLTKEDGVGIQKTKLTSDFADCIIGERHYSYVDIARNDGLDPADLLDWFTVYELTRPMAIIHFTKFRY